MNPKKRRKSFKTPSRSRAAVLRVALTEVLAGQTEPLIFTDLFDLAIAVPKVREAYPTMNEEMLRLNFYEQAQNMVTEGAATKEGRAYAITEKGRKEAEDGEDS